MPRVLYILGYGRSGSTVLDSLLHQCTGLEGTGELARLSHVGWSEGGKGRCACGQQVRACPYWRRVREHFAQTDGPGAIEAYLELEAFFERSWRAWLRLTPGVRDLGGRFTRYARLTAGLYRAIGEVSGRQVVVDSSKLPVRALALLRNPEIDLRLVHLVRDGRAVAWSMLKRHRRLQAKFDRPPTPGRIWPTALKWSLVNLQSEWLTARLPASHWLRLRYEDFVSAPRETLGRIAALAGVAPAAVPGAEALHATRDRHTVAGNRMRKAAVIDISPDFEWTRAMPTHQQRAFWRLAGALQQRYGYVPGTEPRPG